MALLRIKFYCKFFKCKLDNRVEGTNLEQRLEVHAFDNRPHLRYLR